jgi:hypothetical protein
VCVCACVFSELHRSDDMIAVAGVCVCVCVMESRVFWSYLVLQCELPAEPLFIWTTCSGALSRHGWYHELYISSPSQDSCQAGATSCKTARVCTAAEYVLQPATSSADTICAPCTTASTCQPGTALSGLCSGPLWPSTNPSCRACDTSLLQYQDEVSSAV